MEDTKPELLSDQLRVIRDFCLEQNLTLAVAESVTSGFVQLLFSNMSDAGLFYQGGITAYTCEAKRRLLEIPLDVSQPINGVSAEIADLMAKKACESFRADIGLAITGYASLVPELGIVTTFAFGSINLHGSTIHQYSFVSTQPTQLGAQQDFAMQLIQACAAVVEKVTKKPVKQKLKR